MRSRTDSELSPDEKALDSIRFRCIAIDGHVSVLFLGLLLPGMDIDW